MTSDIPESKFDFAGFLDGFQARNLDAIQRNIALHISEMETRLGVIRGQIQSPGSVAAVAAPELDQIDAAFRERSGTIVDRLVSVGERLTSLLIQRGELLKGDPIVTGQLKGLVRAYVNAAEASRSERIIDAAISAAEKFGEMESAPAR